MANKSWIPDAPYRQLGDRVIGSGRPVYITGEIGINHNGDLANAIALIDHAADAGCDAVKFQKRTPEICTPRDQWEIERDTPWGRMSYIDYRHRVEFGIDEFLRSVRRAGAQSRVGVLDRRRPATANASHRPNDHPFDRHVDYAPDPACRRGARQRQHHSVSRHEHLPCAD
jgi:NeuB family